MTRSLREVVPPEFMQEFRNTRAFTLLDCEVVEEVTRTIIMDDQFCDNPNWRPWPGAAKNVHVWWKLADGRCVGWNESPSHGWSFPVYGRKSV